MERLQLRADEQNVASKRVAEKAGFTAEGILRSSHYNPQTRPPHRLRHVLAAPGRALVARRSYSRPCGKTARPPAYARLWPPAGVSSLSTSPPAPRMSLSASPSRSSLRLGRRVGFLLFCVVVLPCARPPPSFVSWAAHDLEPYVIQKELGKRVAFVPLLVGSYAPDMASKWFVYGISPLRHRAQGRQPGPVPSRLARSRLHALTRLRRPDRPGPLRDLAQQGGRLQLRHRAVGARPDGRRRHGRDDAALPVHRPPLRGRRLGVRGPDGTVRRRRRVLQRARLRLGRSLRRLGDPQLARAHARVLPDDGHGGRPVLALGRAVTCPRRRSSPSIAPPSSTASPAGRRG